MPANLVAYYGITASLERGAAMDVIYLDFCKNFGAVHHKLAIYNIYIRGMVLTECTVGLFFIVAFNVLDLG